MNILILNVGSSSLKYALYRNNKLLFKEILEKIFTKKQRMKALLSIANLLEKRKIKVDKVGHRVVHGLKYRKPTRITAKVIKDLKSIVDLAPLHEKPQIEVIEMSSKLFSKNQFAVFDTGFFQSIPEKAKIYGIPYAFTKKGIIRYGFHGISHRFVTKGIKGKVISCHLGSGSSIAAIKNGLPVDMSLGFTPSEGLLMSTRAGDIDPSVVLYLMQHKHYSIQEIETLLNQKSGLLGISGISNDLKVLIGKEKSNKRAKLAVDTFVYRVISYIGKYAAAMNGVDTIIFTAGIGEHSNSLRKRVCDQLSFLGVAIDNKKNKEHRKIISSSRSKVKVLVIPTDEEKEIMNQIK